MTKKAKLPGLPAVTKDNLVDVVRALVERAEVREGARGDPNEAVVLRRDIEGVQSLASSINARRYSYGSGTDGVTVDLGGGVYGTIPFDRFNDMITRSPLYKDLLYRLDDPARFDNLYEEIRGLVTTSIAEKAAQLGASITRVESKTQTDIASVATSLQEITAGIEGSVSGVRSLTFATANTVQAQSGTINQVQARLNGSLVTAADILGPYASLAALLGISSPATNKYYNVNNQHLYRYDPALRAWTQVGTMKSDGTGALSVTTTVESQMVATVNRVTGAEGKYTVKVNAGGAVAGFGLLATDNLQGVTDSSFIVQADKFAVVDTSVSNLTSAKTVFGVDTATSSVFLNGNVYIRGATRIGSPSGQTIQSGLRGAVITSGTTSAYGWDDSAARTAVYSTLPSFLVQQNPSGQTNAVLIAGDTVTLNKPDGSKETRIWDGIGSWVSRASTFIDGSVLVNGSVSATKINTTGLTIYDETGSPMFVSGQKTDWSKLLVGKIDLDAKIGPTAALSTVSLFDGVNTVKLKVSDFVNALSKINVTNIGTFFDNAAIGQAYIGRGAVGTLQIEQLAVSDEHLKDNSVTGRQLVRGTSTRLITLGALAVGWDTPATAVTTAQLEGGDFVAGSVSAYCQLSGGGAARLYLAIGWMHPAGYSETLAFGEVDTYGKISITLPLNIQVPASAQLQSATIWAQAATVASPGISAQITNLAGSFVVGRR